MSARRAKHRNDAPDAAGGGGFIRLGEGVRKGSETGSDKGKVALVPGALAPVLALDLPAGVRGVARERIAARALRDLTGLGPDRMDIRPLPGPTPHGWTRVLITDPDHLAGWRDTAGAARALLPDYLSLPTTEGLWTLQMRTPEDDSGAELLARLGPEDGFTIEPDTARLMLERALRDTPAPPRAVLWIGAPDPAIAALFDTAGVPQISRPAEATDHGLEIPSVLTHGEETCDLRHDPGQERDHLRRRVLPWRWPALIAAAALTLWCAALVLETRSLRDQTTTVTARTQQLTRQHFLPTGPLLDIRAQITRERDARQARTPGADTRRSALDLMNRAAGLIHDAGPAMVAGVDDLLYTPEGGLVARLQVPDYTAQDRLTETLSTGGLQVGIIETGLSEDGDTVRVELALTLKGDAP